MPEHTPAHAEGAHPAAHVVSWKLYVGIFLALCVLTTSSVVVTGFDLGPFNLFLALAISVAKSTLVVLYFMHARYSPKLTGVVIAAAIAFFVILIFLTLGDYVSRPWPVIGGSGGRDGPHEASISSVRCPFPLSGPVVRSLA